MTGYRYVFEPNNPPKANVPLLVQFCDWDGGLTNWRFYYCDDTNCIRRWTDDVFIDFTPCTWDYSYIASITGEVMVDRFVEPYDKSIRRFHALHCDPSYEDLPKTKQYLYLPQDIGSKNYSTKFTILTADLAPDASSLTRGFVKVGWRLKFVENKLKVIGFAVRNGDWDNDYEITIHNGDAIQINRKRSVSLATSAVLSDMVFLTNLLNDFDIGYDITTEEHRDILVKRHFLCFKENLEITSIMEKSHEA